MDNTNIKDNAVNGKLIAQKGMDKFVEFVQKTQAAI